MSQYSRGAGPSTVQVATNLAYAKREYDLKNEHLGILLGVKAQRVSDLINAAMQGKGVLTFEHVAILADALQIPLDVVRMSSTDFKRWLLDHPGIIDIQAFERTPDKVKHRSGWRAGIVQLASLPQVIDLTCR